MSRLVYKTSMYVFVCCTASHFWVINSQVRCVFPQFPSCSMTSFHDRHDQETGRRQLKYYDSEQHVIFRNIFYMYIRLCILVAVRLPQPQKLAKHLHLLFC